MANDPQYWKERTTIPSQAEAEAGTDNYKKMTPLRTAQAIAALGGGSGLSQIDGDFNSESDVAVLICAGQSNSYGLGATMSGPDQLASLANVKMLQASTMTSYTTAIAWTAYSSTDNIIGEPASSQTYNMGTEFARLWQAHIDGGNSLGLPDLYIIHVAEGSQGISPANTTGFDGWSADLDDTDTGSLQYLLGSLVIRGLNNLINSGKNPRVIGVDWNQWERDRLTNYTAQDWKNSVLGLVGTVKDAIGGVDVPWYFHYPISTTQDAATTPTGYGRETIAEAMVDLSESLKYGRMIDARDNPSYTGSGPNFGVFQGDNVHYLGTVHQWFASQLWSSVFTYGYKGANTGIAAKTIRTGSQVIEVVGGGSGAAYTAPPIASDGGWQLDGTGSTLDDYGAAEGVQAVWLHLDSSAGSANFAAATRATSGNFDAKLHIPTAVREGAYGICVMESSTGKFISFNYAAASSKSLSVVRLTNLTTVSATMATVTPVTTYRQGLVCEWLRIQDNGTNLIFSFSFDGIEWIVAYSASRTAFLTGGPNRVGLFAGNNTSSAASVCDSLTIT